MLSIVLFAQVFLSGTESVSSCPSACNCLAAYVDCSGHQLLDLPIGIPLWVKRLNLNNNLITEIKNNSFDDFSELTELKLSKNKISKIGKDLFNKLKHLDVLEINKNSLRSIDSLTFDGLKNLVELRLRHNDISNLSDGAFYHLSGLTILKLDNNSIQKITKGWLYGLSNLKELHLGFNNINIIEDDTWESCTLLVFLDLSSNQLNQVQSKYFHGLSQLKRLKLSHNKITAIDERAFSSLSSLQFLELNNNFISWVTEDMSGAFLGLENLLSLNLASNQITSISHDALLGLTSLRELNLENNKIKTIQINAFNGIPLTKLLINSSSLLCDCHIAWFSSWLSSHSFHLPGLVCAYPESLQGRILTDVVTEDLTCSNNVSPKPVIIEGPKSAVIVSGSQANISCHATSSSNSTLIFKWKKNKDEISAFQKVITNSSAVLSFSNVSLEHAGNYQCIVSNNFGTAYSKKANLTVLVMPTMIKRPLNLTVRAGSTARLECAAVGLPPPQVGWQKDGGTQFPAAHERRMHVMPTDDVFFIINTKPSDSGLYSCIARNSAGTVVANASLTVLDPPAILNKIDDQEIIAGKPFVVNCIASGWPKPKIKWWKDDVQIKPSMRVHFATNNQLLIVTKSEVSDSGSYVCEIKNMLGTEKGVAKIIVSSSALRKTEDDTTGIIIIAVVCCAVGTSALWVIIIYHSQKRLKSEQGIGVPVATNHTDSKSELSASSKDSGTGDSHRSNENLHLETNLCLQDFNESSGNAEAESPLMSAFTLVIEEDPECKDCNRKNDHQFPRFNHDRLSSSNTCDISHTPVSVCIENQPNSFLCVFNSSHPTTV